MTDQEFIEKIIKIVKNSTWSEIARLGINAQQAQKIRTGKTVKFQPRTLARLRRKMKVSA